VVGTRLLQVSRTEYDLAYARGTALLPPGGMDTHACAALQLPHPYANLAQWQPPVLLPGAQRRREFSPRASLEQLRRGSERYSTSAHSWRRFFRRHSGIVLRVCQVEPNPPMTLCVQRSLASVSIDPVHALIRAGLSGLPATGPTPELEMHDRALSLARCGRAAGILSSGCEGALHAPCPHRYLRFPKKHLGRRVT